MKSFFQYAIVLLLTIAPSIITAFPSGRTLSGKVAPKNKFARLNSMQIGMARKPAGSQEEDLELTRAIIMKHIASADDMVADDDDEPQTSDADSSTSGEGEQQPLKKIKSIGTKIKKKLKNKMKKEE